MEKRCNEQGQVLPLMVLVVLAAVVSALLVARVAAAASDRGRAKTAADAAALAGVAQGRDEAEEVAERNGGVVVDYRRAAQQVEVTVEVDGARATARAASRSG